MYIKQIEAFIQVALTGSFSKAAEKLYLAQPSVSSRIKALENEVGCSLFDRNGKSIVLNEAGESFLPYAQKMIQNFEDGLIHVQKAKELVEGELEIASVIIAANYWLPPMTKLLYDTYPNVKMRVHTRHSFQVLDMVLTHGVPFGITRHITHPEIEKVTLLEDEIVLATFTSHPLSNADEVSIKQLAHEPLILFNRGSHDWSLIHSAFRQVNITPNVILEIDNIEATKRMIKNEIGIALMSRFTLEEEVRSNELHLLRITDMPQFQGDLELIYLKNKPLHGIEKLCLDFFKTQTNFPHVR